MRSLCKLLKYNLNYIKLTRSFSVSTAQIIDGKKISEDVQNEVKTEIDEWLKKGKRAPHLIAILVGEDPASNTYVTKKMEASRKVGIWSDTLKLPEETTQAELVKRIQIYNCDDKVDGILVQLPLPSHMDEREVCNAVAVDKDVDGFHIVNIGKLTLNMDTFVPATALGVVELIKRTGVETKGKNAVICGRSKNVGLPMAMILHSDYRNALPGFEITTTICHRNTPEEELRRHLKSADFVISATGIVGLIKPEMIKPGCVVIDVGLTRIKTPEGKTKLVGDVDFEGCSKVAGHITPVPGGVGPMTVAMLMKNTLKAARILNDQRQATK